MDMTTNAPPMQIADYFAILRRRKLHMISVFLLIAGVSVALALGLPPVFRSEATILVERQEIPADLVETTVTGFVEERLEGLNKRLLTRSNLWAVAETLDVYPGMRNERNKADLLKQMRQSVSVQMLSVKGSDPDRKLGGLLTVAFTVAYEDSDPKVARVVAQELARLYIEGNQKLRAEHAAEVEIFLDQEAERLRNTLIELEQQMGRFKQQNVGQTPDQKNLNLRFYEQTEDRLNRSEESIRLLEVQRDGILAQLAITDPHRSLVNQEGKRLQSGGERLRVLMSEYLRASTVYSADHPDLIRMRGEIESLEAQVGVTNKVSDLVATLELYKKRLSEARQKYSAQHPDVRKLQQSMMAIEQELRNSTYAASASSAGVHNAPDNPVYITLKTRLETVQANLRSEEENRARLSEKLREYEVRLLQAPNVEQEYLELSRDYENARSKYREIRQKQSEAELAHTLERGSKAERFTLVQPAYLPTLPERPNRIGIALLGTVFAFAGGIGAVTVAEVMDNTVRGIRGVVVIFNAPPLAVIPYIMTPEEQARVRQRKVRIIIGVAVLIVAAAVMIFGLG